MRLEGEDCDRTENLGAVYAAIGCLRPIQRPEATLSWGIVRRVCQFVEAYVSGGGRRSFWDSVRRLDSVHSSSNMVPLSIESLVLRKAKEEVETEDLRFWSVKSVPFLQEGEQ